MEKYNFTWSDFQDNVHQYFKEIRQDNSLFDVTLVSDDNKEIEAHKFVLCAASSFFRNLLQIHKHPHPLLYIKGSKMKELSAVLEFMYMGEVNIEQEDIEDFFDTATDLQIKGLSRENLDPIYSDLKESDDSDAETIIYSQISKTPTNLLKSYEEMGNSRTEDANDKTEVYVSMDHIYDTIKKKDEDDDELIILREGLWQCKLCDKSDKKKTTMKCHLQVHSSSASHSCSYCAKTFKNKNSLKIHKYKTHTSDKILQRSLIAMT